MENTAKEIPDVILRDMPPDVHKILVREQAKQKEERGINQFSLASTAYKIIREWERCQESKT